ncbi:MAG: response regulator [Oscillospiraceae bacterium]|nr:response regulator [Oscillospiraceae bacterium]
MNILIVDDEPVIVLGIVKRIQRMENLYTQTVGAYSGESALEIMQDFIPDMLITDIQMPHMDGFALISRVREKGICPNYIILTAYENFDYARQAVRYHAIDYLVKPVDWTILEGHLRDFAMQSDKKVDLERVLGEFPVLRDVRPDMQSHLLGKIIKYIETNYMKEISLTQLSIFSGISENYICNLFKKEMDQTFLDFVCKLRLRKAIELLITDEDRNMREISAMLGYRSERQFFRLFKAKLSMTPQQLREAYLS